MKKAFAIAVGLAFLLVCMPAMAETVSGPGYAAGSVGSYTYDPYTGQVDVQWSTAYGVNPYGNPATTTTTATETRGGMGIMINSHNETANGRSFSAGQTTDASRYSDACRENVTEEVNVAGSDVATCGPSQFFLETWSESAHSQVGIDYADQVEANHWASNAEGDTANASFTASSVADYLGGAVADAGMAQVGQEVAIAADVSAEATAANAAGMTATVTFEGDTVVDLEQQATAVVDEVEAVQEAGIATFGTFTNSSAVGGHAVTTSTTGDLVTGYNGQAFATAGSFAVEPFPGAHVTGDYAVAASTQAFDVATDVTTTSTADSQAGNSATSSTTASVLTDYRSGSVAGDLDMAVTLPPAMAIDGASLTVDGAATGQYFGTATLFATSNSSESVTGAEAFANAEGVAATNMFGGAAAVTGSVSWNPTYSFDVAGAVIGGEYFRAGEDGSIAVGAETGDGIWQAEVSADGLNDNTVLGFGQGGWFLAGAAAGTAGPYVGAGAGAHGVGYNGQWNTAATTGTGPDDFGSTAGANAGVFWGGYAYDSPAGSGALAP